MHFIHITIPLIIGLHETNLNLLKIIRDGYFA